LHTKQTISLLEALSKRTCSFLHFEHLTFKNLFLVSFSDIILN